MSVVLVADIFGRTTALTTLAKELDAAVIVDPYDGVDMGFSHEAQAYAYFMAQVGIEAYCLVLLKTLASTLTVTDLVGFSVGAAVIWKLSEHQSLKQIRRGICYYGSQIRNFKQLNPLFELELIFPKLEGHFDVEQLQTELSTKQNVKASKVDYLHGFMNACSTNYDPLGYQQQLNWLQLRLKP